MKDLIDKIAFFDTWFIAYPAIAIMILSMTTIPSDYFLEATGIFILFICIFSEAQELPIAIKIKETITAK